MPSKSAFQSKTLWFAALTILVGVANAFGLADFTPSEQSAEYVLIIVGIINAVLRFRSAQPVTL